MYEIKAVGYWGLHCQVAENWIMGDEPSEKDSTTI
jgi:hypothetical protein